MQAMAGQSVQARASANAQGRYASQAALQQNYNNAATNLMYGGQYGGMMGYGNQFQYGAGFNAGFNGGAYLGF